MKFGVNNYNVSLSFLLITLGALFFFSFGVNAKEKQNSDLPRYKIAKDFSAVRPLDNAIAKTDSAGNISPLLMQMAINKVIAVFNNDKTAGETEEIPFNPLVLGDQEFLYIPFFDAEEEYVTWTEDLSEEVLSQLSPVVLDGSFFFSVISSTDYNVVLNPHSEDREIIYNNNLVWLSYKANALNEAAANGIEDLRIVANMSQMLPPNANKNKLLEDLKKFISVRPVDKAYLYLNDVYDRDEDKAYRDIMIVIPSDSNEILNESYAKKMTAEFGFEAKNYNLKNDISLEFIIVGDDKDAMNALLENSQYFYNKKKEN